MAFLEKRGKVYHAVFRYGGRRYSTTLKTEADDEAEALLGGVEKTLLRLRQGLLVLPEGGDVLSFVLTEGRQAAKPHFKPVLTLRELCEQYEASSAARSIEPNSLETVRLHLSHFKRLLKESFPVQTLSGPTLQGCVDRRSQERGHRGRRVSPVTIKKEVTSFSGVWSWGVKAGLLKGSFPSKGLDYPKTTDKPPFRTFAEIERQVARGGLTEQEEARLWECLFLTLPEVEELLRFVKENADHAFVYPMLCAAAHTGARRSELVRSLVDDWDFEGPTVIIREKKRVKGRLSFRRVPMSPLLGQVMKEWLTQRHPGGTHAFCQELHVSRSSKTRAEYQPLTRNEANHHLQRLLQGSKWEKVRGWHVLRHSFASNCAAQGVDQRLINGWMGHQTEAMVRRYRHLIPDQQQTAIRSVFATSQVAISSAPGGQAA